MSSPPTPKVSSRSPLRHHHDSDTKTPPLVTPLYEESHRLQMEEVYEKIMRRRKIEAVIDEYEHDHRNATSPNAASSRLHGTGESRHSLPHGGVTEDPSLEPGASSYVARAATHPVHPQSMTNLDDPDEQFFDSTIAVQLRSLVTCKDALSAVVHANSDPSITAVIGELEMLSATLPKSINELSLNFHCSHREERCLLEAEIEELSAKVRDLTEELDGFPSSSSSPQRPFQHVSSPWNHNSFVDEVGGSFHSGGSHRMSYTPRGGAGLLRQGQQSDTLRLGMSMGKSKRIASTSAGFEHRRTLYAGIVGINIPTSSGSLGVTAGSTKAQFDSGCSQNIVVDPSFSSPRMSLSIRSGGVLRRGPPTNNVHEGIAMSLAILVEGLATACGAEMVRLFLVDDKGNYVNAASYPPCNEDAPSLDDIRKGHRRLGRPIRTCIERNVGIVGHTPEGTPVCTGEVLRDEEEQSTAAEVKCYLCWPIRGRGNPTVACGALEVINKIDCKNARQLDRDAHGEGTGSNGELYNRQLLAHNVFSADDEARVHCTAESIGVIADRYPIRSPEVLAAASSARATLHGAQVQAGMVHPHLPPEPYQDQLKSLENVMRRVLNAQPQLPLYRGPMYTITSQINRVDEASQHFSSGRMRTGSRQASVVPSGRPTPPQTATGTRVGTDHQGTTTSDSSTGGHQQQQFSSYQWKPPSVLTNIDYNLDSLRTMWLQSHEENIAMHEQCRYWSSRARDLGSMTKCFKEAIAKLLKMRSIETVQNYLGGLDLTLRSGDVQGFLRNIADDSPVVEFVPNQVGATDGNEGGESSPNQAVVPPTTADQQQQQDEPVGGVARTLLQASRVHHVNEGPQNTRTYTIDADAKRTQQEDIAALREEVNASFLWDHMRTLPPNHQVPTSTAESRAVPPRRPHWEIDQHRRDHADRMKRDAAARANPNIPIPTGVFNVAPPADTSKYRLPRSGRVSGRIGTAGSTK